MGAKKISKGKYEYRGFTIQRHGYYPPEKKIVWEGINSQGDVEVYGYTQKEVIDRIDCLIKKEE